MFELARIHKDVSTTSSGGCNKRQRLTRYFGLLSSGPTSTQKPREREILRRWLDYISRIAREDILDFNIALWGLNGKLTFDHQGTARHDALCVNVIVDEQLEAIRWTTYHLARNGPRSISRLWSEDRGIAREAEDNIWADVQRRSP